MIKNGYQLTLIANIEKSISINLMERKLISTGILIQFSKKMKYHFFLKQKLIEAICVIHITKYEKNTVLCQEIKILITNILFETMIIQPNEKLVLVNIFQGTQIKWEPCSILNTSIRGSNGFGSTGI
ncbi:dUTP diphosphatase [Blattabacterium sp. (Blattella germanica) str. Bge]|uniref:dUTP diphosphatase n=1 Tax=Blattabacterium sp. (Blattella germanica) TaxID=624186 RepID=UPI0001BB629F|nr:dUTP diphosphatase [Blattabacterium sp. (Blattella germanica)]ACY40606.1 dUTP diphosphatase [Blattabacterium sp. (Blattella germanica) str. Bge]